MTKRARIAVKIEGIAEIQARLKNIGMTMQSREAIQIVQEGAEIIARRASERAPRGESGNLAAGVYTASRISNRFRQLVRPRTGKRVNQALRYVTVGTALIVNSVFYSRWVEKGRKPRAADPNARNKRLRRAVGLMAGRKRGRPFFRPAIREKRPEAVRYILAGIERLIVQRWNRK